MNVLTVELTRPRRHSWLQWAPNAHHIYPVGCKHVWCLTRTSRPHNTSALSMPETTGASPESAHLAVLPAKRCPRCRSDSVVWLVQMRAHDREHDWYRCRECGDEFAIDRAS